MLMALNWQNCQLNFITFDNYLLVFNFTRSTKNILANFPIKSISHLAVLNHFVYKQLCGWIIWECIFYPLFWHNYRFWISHLDWIIVFSKICTVAIDECVEFWLYLYWLISRDKYHYVSLFEVIIKPLYIAWHVMTWLHCMKSTPFWRYY